MGILLFIQFVLTGAIRSGTSVLYTALGETVAERACVTNRGANQLASGLALGFFGLGLTALIGRPYVSRNITGLNAVPIPLLSDIPLIGSIFFNHDLLTYLGYLMGPLIWLFLYRTRWG